MDDFTNWTPYPDDNLLGLTDSAQLNEAEAEGIARAEIFVFELDTEEPVSTWLILSIHKRAFGLLYDWAGTWRTTQVTAGAIGTAPAQPGTATHVSVCR